MGRRGSISPDIDQRIRSWCIYQSKLVVRWRQKDPTGPFIWPAEYEMSWRAIVSGSCRSSPVRQVTYSSSIRPSKTSSMASVITVPRASPAVLLASSSPSCHGEGSAFLAVDLFGSVAQCRYIQSLRRRRQCIGQLSRDVGPCSLGPLEFAAACCGRRQSIRRETLQVKASGIQSLRQRTRTGFQA